MQKKTFKVILAFLAILLALMPVLVTFNEIFTKFFESLRVYNLIEELIVPREAAIIGVLLSPFKINYAVFKGGIIINSHYVHITWNCTGWQSMLLLLLTFLVGLKGKKFTLYSTMESVVIGFLGTFLVNIIRMFILVLLYIYANSISVYVFHDYFAALVTIVWLSFFWWFSYSYILEEKMTNISKAVLGN